MRKSYDPYMSYTPRYRKPFYLRAWFICLLLLLIAPFAAAGIFWLVLKSEYGPRAAQFDFSKLEEMESASIIYDRNNHVLGRIFLENRDAVPFDHFPEDLIRAVIAAEDARFYNHHGVDFIGMARAAIKNWSARGIRQGASTLTQQLARNTFNLRERTYERKKLEIFLAREIERRLSKQKILELYLNRVYFGAGFYGAEAAARGYFGKSSKNLNLSECATLAGLLKNPNKLSPWSNRQACIDTRNVVLGRMLELKMITPEKHQEETTRTLAVKNRRPIHTDSYAIDMVRQQVNDLVGKGRATADGYRIYTTIDGELQKTAEEAVRARLAEIEHRNGYGHETFAAYDAQFRQWKKNGDPEDRDMPQYLQGAVVALDNTDGAILAMVGGRDFAHSQYNRTTQAARPAGTAFKPLVYAAAFEKDVFPGTLLSDAVIDNRQVMIGGTTGILGEWGPERADNRYEGQIPARLALVKSKNAATVRLGIQTGIDSVIDLAKKAGITRVVGKDEKGRTLLNLRPYNSIFLGSGEVTLMDMTVAYSMFPNGGWRPAEPYIIKRIEEKDGRIAFASKPDRRRVVQESTAYEVHSCLSEVLEWGTGDKAFSKYGLRKFPVAGKTGTAYNFTDTWFIGYSSAVTCGVWAGFDKPQPIYRGAFSNEIALPIWVEVMNATFAKYKPADIPQPRAVKKHEICTKSGQLATDKCVETSDEKTTGMSVERRTTYWEIGTDEQAPKLSCGVHSDAGGGKAMVSTHSPLNEAKSPSQYPRATLAVDLAKVTPVPMKAPTVVAEEDPYKSVKPMSVLVATRVSDNAAPPGATESPTATPAASGAPGTTPGAGGTAAETPAAATSTPPPSPGPGSGPGVAPAKVPPQDTEVRRAEPVRALDQTEDDLTIKLEPPAPIQF